MSELRQPATAETYAPGALAILAAAERLIGQHGIDGVSVRQITLAAGMANNSAVAYHFGDRDGLLKAVSRWRLPVIASERQRLLDQAEAAGEADHPECIVQAITRPVLVVRDTDGSHPHAAFVSQMLRSRLGREIRSAIFGGSGVVGALVSRLHRLAPQIPLPLFEFRLRLGSLAFYDAVVERDRMAPDDPARLPGDDASLLAELDAMLLAVILRPAASSPATGG